MISMSVLGKGTRNLNPSSMISLGFGAIILFGAFLLHLPISARSGEWTPFLTCLFTATSATCVTGLAQVDTFLYWTNFGQLVVLVLIQLGGLGFVSVMTMVSLALRRRIGLTQRLVMASALNLSNTSGVVRVVRHALMGTFLIEGIGAALLSIRFIPMFGFLKGIWFSIFHSISAFCNGGFDLMGEYSGEFTSLSAFTDDPLVLCTIMTLIAVGGLGFFVWEDILLHKRWSKLSLYSKMVLGLTGALIFTGFFVMMWLEWDNPETLGALPVKDRMWNALFQSVTLRTAGYATLNQAGLTDSTSFVCILMMLIGGSSGSTAGGIKTVTAGILALAVWESLRGRDKTVFHGRTIPARRVLDAATLTFAVLFLLTAGTMALSLMDGVGFLDAAYEIASALGTVGLSRGITTALGSGSSLIVILCMYLGRIGVLTFSIAFLTRRTDSKLQYPTAEIMIG